ncbi:MAG TPA: glycosyltransferase family 87 protein [Aquabacterium sp.]|nr:glycosyltransferase family 87 protein [Aquabacterium sp.]
MSRDQYIRTIKLILCWLLLVGMIWFIYLNYAQAGRIALLQPDSTDFYKFYLSADRAAHGKSPFWQTPKRQLPGEPCYPLTPERVAREHSDVPAELRIGAQEDPCLGPNLNPPIFEFLTSPLNQLPYQAAWWIWSSLSILLIAAGTTILAIGGGRNRVSKPLPLLLLIAGSFLYFPSLANFSLGQVGSLCFFLLALAWALSHKGHEACSGAIVGTLIALKPFFLVLLPLLLFSKRPRMVITALGVTAALWWAGWLIYGSEIHRQYFAIASDVTWNGARWNGSWAGIVERILSGQADSTLPPGSSTARVIYSGLSLATVAAVAFAFAWQRKEWDPSESLDHAFAIGIPTALIASPLGWSYYFPCLMLSFWVFWQQAQTRAHVRMWRIWISATLLLSTVPITNAASPRPFQPSVWWGLDSLGFYSLSGTLLLGLAISLTTRSKQP